MTDFPEGYPGFAADQVESLREWVMDNEFVPGVGPSDSPPALIREPQNEILAYVNRDGERFIVVWFPREDSVHSAGVEVLSDAPYWWRQQGRFLDRSEECSS